MCDFVTLARAVVSISQWATRPGRLRSCGTRALSVLVAASLVYAVAAHSASGPLTKSEEGQVYDQAIHILGGNANVISKWVDDIDFAVIGVTSEESQALAHSTLVEVASLTGLSLVPVEHAFSSAQDYLSAVEQAPPFRLAACDVSDATLCANFIVLFADKVTMQALTTAIPLRPVYQRSMSEDQNVHCFFAPFQTRSMEIAQAFVYVRDDLSASMTRTCLQEEIYQSFGLFNDYSGSRFFSFNNVVEPKSITEYDRALLASVYDRRIRPGAPVWKVMETLMEKLAIDPFSR